IFDFHVVDEPAVPALAQLVHDGNVARVADDHGVHGGAVAVHGFTAELHRFIGIGAHAADVGALDGAHQELAELVLLGLGGRAPVGGQYALGHGHVVETALDFAADAWTGLFEGQRVVAQDGEDAVDH